MLVSAVNSVHIHTAVNSVINCTEWDKRKPLLSKTYSENLQREHHCKVLYPSMFFCAAVKIGEQMKLVLLKTDYSYKISEIYQPAKSVSTHTNLIYFKLKITLVLILNH